MKQEEVRNTLNYKPYHKPLYEVGAFYRYVEYLYKEPKDNTAALRKTDVLTLVYQNQNKESMIEYN
jgi:hypothetical protein